MRAVMLSVRPQWCELIASGQKTVEVRKTAPKIPTPFKCYIYETGGEKYGLHRPFGKPFGYEGAQAIVGEFVCDRIETIECSSDAHNHFAKESCLSVDDFVRYCNGQDLFGWHISDLKIYDKPKELSEFHSANGKQINRAFQNWGYVNGKAD